MVSGSGGVEPGIGFAHRVAEPADGRSVFHAARRLDAGRNVNGPRPQLRDAGSDISCMQSTRQNEPMTCCAVRNERPIEHLSTAAISLGVRIEEKALCTFEAACEV